MYVFSQHFKMLPLVTEWPGKPLLLFGILLGSFIKFKFDTYLLTHLPQLYIPCVPKNLVIAFPILMKTSC